MADPQKTPTAPQDFFNLPPDQQQNYLQEPGQLPSDLPQRVGRAGLEALPYAGAAALSIGTGGVGDLLEVPWWLGMLARGTAAGLGGGGGEAVKQEAYRGFKMPEAADTRTEELRRITQAGKQQALTELAGGLVMKPVEMGAARYLNPERVYKSAIHPPGIADQDVTDMLKAGIKHRITPTEEGRQAAEKLAQNFNAQIDQRIAANPVDISPREWTTNLKNRFDKMRTDWGSTAKDSKANIERLDEIEKEFLINHGQVRPLNKIVKWDPDPAKRVYKLVKPEEMTLDELRTRANPISASRMQQIKKATWKGIRAQLNPKGGAVRIPGFAANTNPGLELEADEEMGRMLREELGNVPAYKGIHQLNAEEGAMYELTRAIDRSLINEGRKRVFPYWLTPVAVGTAEAGSALGRHWGTAGEVLGGVAGAALPFTRELLETPMSKARIAFAGERLGREGFLPSMGRSTVRGVPAAAGRGFEYLTDQGPAPSPGQEQPLEIDPKDFQPAAEAPAAPAGAPTAASAAPNQPPLKSTDQAVLDREAQQNINPTPGWSSEHSRMLADASQRIGVPLSLLHVVAEREGSRGNPLIRSPKGAVGLMQVMPATGKQYGYSEKELEDPQKNIDAAARVLKDLMSRPQLKDKPGLILAAYNAGEGAVQKAGYKLYNMPDETRQYVLKGMQRWAQLGLPPEQAAQYSTILPEP